MNLDLTVNFVTKLNEQIEYIAKDKPTAARKFKDTILNAVLKLPLNPEKGRKSIYFNNDNIRDLVIKSYTVVYRVDYNENLISVFGFTRFEQNPFKNMF
jgi:plasmid stabilization system protein ParE